MPGDFPVRGDIYHVDFDEPIGKHFAVVVTTDPINAKSDSVVLALITTKHVDKRPPHHFVIPKGVLYKPAKVKCDNLMMWPKQELNKDTYVSNIGKRDMQGLDIALEHALDLWQP